MKYFNPETDLIEGLIFISPQSGSKFKISKVSHLIPNARITQCAKVDNDLDLNSPCEPYYEYDSKKAEIIFDPRETQTINYEIF